MRKLILLFILLLSATVYADPPSRVARISYLQGITSFSPAGEKIWVNSKLNRPLIPGDRLWADTHARAEIQLGSAVVRIEDGSSLKVLNLNDRIAQFQLSRGTLILRVRNMTPDQTYEIDTPSLAFVVRTSGNYRIDVDQDSNTTTVRVRSGKGIVYAKNHSFSMKTGQSFRFVGTQFLNYQVLKRDVLDSFDRWSLQRDHSATRAKSARYVSTTMVGYEDLDNYGSWRFVPEYGNVWAPRNVHRNWAPYRNGHWAWINPWGWTWIDDEPWGFAPSHYGRWAYYRNSWVWIPGPRTAQAHYAPALVVFVSNASAGVAWFPLGPRDVYVPPYQVSQNYFTSVNVSNTTINNTRILNVYNNTTVQNNYMNAQIPNAITAVPATTFTQAQPVANSIVPVSQDMSYHTSVTPAAPVAPTSQSTIGASTSTGTTPPQSALDVTTTAVTPPAPSVDDKSTTIVTPPAPSSSDAVAPVAPTSGTDKPSTSVTPAAPNTDSDKPATGVTPTAPSSESTTVTPTAPSSDSDKSATPVTPTAPSSESTTVTPTAPSSDSDKPTTSVTPTAPSSDERGKPSTTVTPTAPPETEKPSVDAEIQKVAAEQQAEADKAAAEQQAAASKAATEKAEADKAAAEQQAAAEKAAAEKAEADKAAAEQQAAAEKAAAEKAEADKAAAEQAEAQKVAGEKAEADKAAAEQQAAAEKAAAEKAEADKAAAEQQAAAEKAAAEKAEADKAAAEQQVAAEKAAAEKAEADKAAADKAAADPSTATTTTPAAPPQ